MRSGREKLVASLLTAWCLLIASLVGCGGGGGGPATSGTVEGVVVDATNPSVPVENAYCYIPIPPARAAGVGRQDVIEDYTDSQGRYQLDQVPLDEDLPLIVEATPQSSTDFVRMELSVRTVTAAEPTVQEVTVITPAVAGLITELAIQPDSALVKVGQTKQLAATVSGGYSGSLRPTWWVTGGIGTIDANGLFTASRAGTGAVHVGLGAFEAQAVVTTVVQGMIAFSSDRDGNYEVYAMNSDGTQQRNLTNNPAQDWVPSWSPDGSKIAFVSDRDGNTEIYVTDFDGTNQTRLTNTAADDFKPSWSPDGSKIAFASNRDGNYEIYVMNSDGTNQIRLTNDPAEDSGPSWSPDANKIAFASNRDGNYEIYVMDPDGTNQTRLTNDPAGDSGPSWSPDASRIAFTSLRDSNYEIYIMNSDGTSQTRLTNNVAIDYWPSWSPDGTKIAFVSNRDGNYEVYVMSSSGISQTNITVSPALDAGPCWWPF